MQAEFAGTVRDLHAAGAALGNRRLSAAFAYLGEQFRAYSLGNVVFFLFKAIAAGNAAAACISIFHGHAVKAAQQFQPRQAVALCPQMAGRVVDQLEVGQGLLAVGLQRKVAAVHSIQQKFLRVRKTACAVFFRHIREVFRQINPEHEGATGAARHHG